MTDRLTAATTVFVVPSGPDADALKYPASWFPAPAATV